MTPQSTFMVLGQSFHTVQAELRRLLDSMNHSPGRVNANNALVPSDNSRAAPAQICHPSGQFSLMTFWCMACLGETIRFAWRSSALWMVIETFLKDMRGASTGLRAIFSCCKGFAADTDLLAWMRRTAAPIAAYTNYLGRTVRQVREEAALREALDGYAQNNEAARAAYASRSP